ncbi:hypothetical protein O9Y75_26330, partial [Klebsiella pneumoniae]|nr:hypothetical protein [Klebsiella pneumoniae]
MKVVIARKLHQLLHPSLTFKSLLQMVKKLRLIGATLTSQTAEVDQNTRIDTAASVGRANPVYVLGDSDQRMRTFTKQARLLSPTVLI